MQTPKRMVEAFEQASLTALVNDPVYFEDILERVNEVFKREYYRLMDAYLSDTPQQFEQVFDKAFRPMLLKLADSREKFSR